MNQHQEQIIKSEEEGIEQTVDGLKSRLSAFASRSAAWLVVSDAIQRNLGHILVPRSSGMGEAVARIEQAAGLIKQLQVQLDNAEKHKQGLRDEVKHAREGWNQAINNANEAIDRNAKLRGENADLAKRLQSVNEAMPVIQALADDIAKDRDLWRNRAEGVRDQLEQHSQRIENLTVERDAYRTQCQTYAERLMAMTRVQAPNFTIKPILGGDFEVKPAHDKTASELHDEQLAIRVGEDRPRASTTMDPSDEAMAGAAYSRYSDVGHAEVLRDSVAQEYAEPAPEGTVAQTAPGLKEATVLEGDQGGVALLVPLPSGWGLHRTL